MGIGPFRSNCTNCHVISNKTAPNPDPLNFVIVDLQQVKLNVVATIRYLDCTNFEGVKICVFKNMTTNDIRGMDEIDSHFSKSDYSPIARFKPDEEGLNLALILAYNL